MNGSTTGKGATSKSVGKTKLHIRAHICPPSQATHPCDRWETAFVYAFITKFTNLRAKVEGFEGPSDLEDALMSPIQHPVLVQILARFVLNLKPLAKNLNPDQLTATVASILHEHIKSPTERTVFWNEQQQRNVDPFAGVAGGFWGCDWDLKLRILRMLVELQLTHSHAVKEIIDKEWTAHANKPKPKPEPKKKKKDEPKQETKEEISEPSLNAFQTVPVAQDASRLRYWHFDDSPRLYVSGNPWKMACEFRCKTRTRDDFIKVVEDLKDVEAKMNPNKKTKLEDAHCYLRDTLEKRIELIDKEQARVLKVRKKIEQREILKAQAELRQTRTRRSTRRPDYVYSGQDFGDDEEGDEYKDQGEDDYDEDNYDFDDEDGVGKRRSQRVSEKNANGKRGADAVGDWKGERRSTRLGTNPDISDYGPQKRQRTEERSTSSAPSETLESPMQETNDISNVGGTKKVKGGEVAVEQVAGKKKSKYWFYAVEPSSAGTTAMTSAGVESAVGEATSTVTTNGNTKTEDDIKIEELTDRPKEIETEPPAPKNGMNGHVEGVKQVEMKPPNGISDHKLETPNGGLTVAPMETEIGA